MLFIMTNLRIVIYINDAMSTLFMNTLLQSDINRISFELFLIGDLYSESIKAVSVLFDILVIC